VPIAANRKRTYGLLQSESPAAMQKAIFESWLSKACCARE